MSGHYKQHRLPSSTGCPHGGYQSFAGFHAAAVATDIDVHSESPMPKRSRRTRVYRCHVTLHHDDDTCGSDRDGRVGEVGGGPAGWPLPCQQEGHDDDNDDNDDDYDEEASGSNDRGSNSK